MLIVRLTETTNMSLGDEPVDLGDMHSRDVPLPHIFIPGLEPGIYHVNIEDKGAQP